MFLFLHHSLLRQASPHEKVDDLFASRCEDDERAVPGELEEGQGINWSIGWLLKLKLDTGVHPYDINSSTLSMCLHGTHIMPKKTMHLTSSKSLILKRLLSATPSTSRISDLNATVDEVKITFIALAPNRNINGAPKLTCRRLNCVLSKYKPLIATILWDRPRLWRRGLPTTASRRSTAMTWKHPRITEGALFMKARSRTFLKFLTSTRVHE